MTSICFHFKNISPDRQAVLVALLNELGFTGFEEREDQLLAFADEKLLTEEEVRNYLAAFDGSLGFSAERIVEKNWNEEWEKSFQPVMIGDQVIVRATFHPENNHFRHQIIINPKMSFGTGHHATTEMMMRLMLQENIKDCSVLDFGSGTGILSVLAYQLGARRIRAIDHEDWAIENCRENFRLNHLPQEMYEVIQNENFDFGKEPYQVILANINRNILLAAMHSLSGVQQPGGRLLMSGFYEADIPAITEAAAVNGYEVSRKMLLNNWCALVCAKK